MTKTHLYLTSAHMCTIRPFV